MMSRTTLFAAALFGLAVTPALAGDVVVEVTGVASSEGSVLCALHPEGSPFPGTGPGVVTASAPADPGGAACRFTDVAAGTYAIAVFHDANGNQELDTNFIGIPREDWAVSNDARPAVGAPRFRDAALQIPKAGGTVRISLKN